MNERKENNLASIVLFCVIAAAVGLVLYSHNRPGDSTVQPTANTTVTNQPSEAEMDQFSQSYEETQADQATQMQEDMNNSTVSQSYYYCWDTGTSSPHHLGYRANGDHYCTDGELHDARVNGY